jgi:hypothetical protein
MTSVNTTDWVPTIQKCLEKEVSRIVKEEAALAARRVEEKVRELAPLVACRVGQTLTEYHGKPQLDIVVKFWEAGEKP